VRFSQGALRRLQEHRWPGNVRELRNVVSRAVLLNTGGPVREVDIQITRRFTRIDTGGNVLAGPGFTSRPSQGRLEELLGEEAGNISALARRLRVCTKTVYRWVKVYRIDLLSIWGAFF
jgi:transcriptional regulator of acetoin/glycerol metabolism